MKRVLSGVQPSGQLHIGNYAGAIRQFVEMQSSHEMFIFVASYHALTSTRNADLLRTNLRQTAIDYIAFGLDPSQTHLYYQHDVPEVTELAWLLSCCCPQPLMDKSTPVNDKAANGLSASIWLYTYPILQSADILAVDADLVPVGEEQVQHIEITRDIAQKFNHHFGEVFKLPIYQVCQEAGIVPEIDGQKMSKSYGNEIDPVMAEGALRKLIMKIKTDSTPIDEPKDPETCSVYQSFAALAGRDDERSKDLARRYRKGGMGYGDAKQALLELVLDHFAEARSRRRQLGDNVHPPYHERLRCATPLTG